MLRKIDVLDLAKQSLRFSNTINQTYYL